MKFSTKVEKMINKGLIPSEEIIASINDDIVDAECIVKEFTDVFGNLAETVTFAVRASFHKTVRQIVLCTLKQTNNLIEAQEVLEKVYKIEERRVESEEYDTVIDEDKVYYSLDIVEAAEFYLRKIVSVYIWDTYGIDNEDDIPDTDEELENLVTIKI